MSGRRRFLQMVGAGAVAACGGKNDGTSSGVPLNSSGPTLPANYVDMKQNLSGLTPGMLVGAGGFAGIQPALLMLEASGGLYAMTALCAHLQCNLNFNKMPIAGGFQCSCHGSQYDFNGHVLHGPATHDLDHFAVAVNDAGEIGVDFATKVAPTVRLQVM